MRAYVCMLQFSIGCSFSSRSPLLTCNYGRNSSLTFYAFDGVDHWWLHLAETVHGVFTVFHRFLGKWNFGWNLAGIIAPLIRERADLTSYPWRTAMRTRHTELKMQRDFIYFPYLEKYKWFAWIWLWRIMQCACVCTLLVASIVSSVVFASYIYVRAHYMCLHRTLKRMAYDYTHTNATIQTQTITIDNWHIRSFAPAFFEAHHIAVQIKTVVVHVYNLFY